MKAWPTTLAAFSSWTSPHPPPSPCRSINFKASPITAPARDDIAITSPGTVLFEGKVSRDLEDKGSYLSFAGNLAATQIADVIVTDKSFYGYKDNTKIPYAELAKIKLDAKKAYFFVESATLTTIGRKIYDQTAVGSNIKGAAFAANGKVYVSDSAFTYDALLAVDVFDLRQLHPQTSVESPQITKLLEGPKLTQTQAVELSQTLRKNSMQKRPNLHFPPK